MKISLFLFAHIRRMSRKLKLLADMSLAAVPAGGEQEVDGPTATAVMGVSHSPTARPSTSEMPLRVAEVTVRPQETNAAHRGWTYRGISHLLSHDVPLRRCRKPHPVGGGGHQDNSCPLGLAHTGLFFTFIFMRVGEGIICEREERW